jgi:CBS domain-containing protein
MSRAIAVEELMVQSPVTLRPEMDMEEAIGILLKHKISGATVINEQRQVVGVLSEKDCLRIFANGAYNALPSAPVAEFMSKEVTTIGPDADLFTVADLFLKHSFRRLPVVKEGVLVGQVSRRDVLAGSRELWEESPVKKEWTDSKYISDELRARLDAKGS